MDMVNDNWTLATKRDAVAKYRDNLPQCHDKKLFLVDGGLETTLVFHMGIDLPVFGSFMELQTKEGTQRLRDYFSKFAKLAVANKLNFILESPTGKATRSWSYEVGMPNLHLELINVKAVRLMKEIRDEYENENSKMVVCGRIGPRDDAYVVDKETIMTPKDAQMYHMQQVVWFEETGVDFILFINLNYPAEGIGVVMAGQKRNLPVVLSFTLETDGQLPNGQTLQSAIEEIDAATNNGPVYYMINCTHPTHFAHLFEGPMEPWMKRIQGIQANASTKSHAELDKAKQLDSGNPEEFGRQMAELKQKMPHINIIGGCCGTDYRHIEQICRTCGL